VTLTLWDQENEVLLLQKRCGIDEPLVEVFSNDERLRDLLAWDPAADDDGVRPSAQAAAAVKAAPRTVRSTGRRGRR
jgi:hypothetical protein